MFKQKRQNSGQKAQQSGGFARFALFCLFDSTCLLDRESH
jgi:hypothetical protein